MNGQKISLDVDNFSRGKQHAMAMVDGAGSGSPEHNQVIRRTTCSFWHTFWRGGFITFPLAISVLQIMTITMQLCCCTLQLSNLCQNGNEMSDPQSPSVDSCKCDQILYIICSAKVNREREWEKTWMNPTAKGKKRKRKTHEKRVSCVTSTSCGVWAPLALGIHSMIWHSCNNNWPIFLEHLYLSLMVGARARLPRPIIPVPPIADYEFTFAHTVKWTHSTRYTHIDQCYIDWMVDIHLFG